MSRRGGHGVSPLLCSALLLVGCTIKALPHEGRTCAGSEVCGPGTVCDPSTLTCKKEGEPDPDLRLPDTLGADLGRDLGRDQPVDTSPVPRLSCTEPELVGEPVDHQMGKPAIRVDGLELHSIYSNTQRYQTARPGLDQPFDPWSDASFFPDTTQDPCFFQALDQEWVMMAQALVQDEPRKLYLCPVETGLGSCEAVTVIDKATDQVIDVDMDGPSVVVPAGYGPIMAFNVQPGDEPTAEIYLAEPAGPDDLSTWVARRAEGVNQPDRKEDDPGLSPDGLVLISTLPSDGESYGDLWVAYRSDLSASFSELEPLDALNTASSEHNPDIIALPDGRLEVFFGSGRDSSVSQIYRAVCSR